MPRDPQELEALVRHPNRPGAKERLAVLADEACSELHAARAASIEAAASERRLRDELDRITEALYGTREERSGRRRHRLPVRWRRPRHPRPEPLLPPPPGAVTLWGRALRHAVLAVLAVHGGGQPMELIEIHRCLHRNGYRIGGTHPVKRLADACGYEHRIGRMQRSRRGEYSLLALDPRTRRRYAQAFLGPRPPGRPSPRATSGAIEAPEGWDETSSTGRPRGSGWASQGAPGSRGRW